MKSNAKMFALYAMAMAAFGSQSSLGKSEQQIDSRNPLNPHNLMRFETDGFVTYSVNQEAHDAKYSKYLKRKNK